MAARDGWCVLVDLRVVRDRRRGFCWLAFAYRRAGGAWVLLAVEGIVGIAIGVFILAAPDHGATVVWYGLAGWAFVTGVILFIGSIVTVRPHGGPLFALVR
jgi:hypothetical protein